MHSSFEFLFTTFFDQSTNDQNFFFNQATFDQGSPLVFVGGEDYLVEEWPGMKPSDCWIDSGISEVRGQSVILLHKCLSGENCNHLLNLSI